MKAARQTMLDAIRKDCTERFGAGADASEMNIMIAPSPIWQEMLRESGSNMI